MGIAAGQAPSAFRSLPQWGGATTEVPHAGEQARVTTLERTLADVLDKPDKSGGWEEIWRSLEMAEFFDLDVIRAAGRLISRWNLIVPESVLDLCWEEVV